MSKQAVTERMESLNEISKLSEKLGIRGIYHFQDDIYVQDRSKQ